MNSSIQASTGEKGGVRHLYVDATGMLELRGQAHTGIPRVQDFLVRSALADSDPAIKVVVYDSGSAAYRCLTEHEVALLTFDPIGGSNDGNGRALGIWGSLRDAFQAISVNPYLGREFDRDIARDLADSRAINAKYSAIKYIVRSYRFLSKIIDIVYPKFQKNLELIDLSDGVLLISHHSIVGHNFSESIISSNYCAFICYDLIPWIDSELSLGKKHSDRFNARLKILISHDARAVCISDTSMTMLDRFISENSLEGRTIGRFTLPSILYQKALANGTASRLPCDKDFILYCSTIEVRKNHLLLAKIWKQAFDEGVTLPKLVCAGKWGWGVEELKAFLDDNPALSQSIEFIGQVNDDRLIDLYRSALFGVMPSKIEGWGFGASECLDFGVPVIVSTAPSLVEAVRGLMPAIDADNQDAWYAEIRKLAESVEARNSLRDKIAQFYRPVTCESSWATVKSTLLN